MTIKECIVKAAKLLGLNDFAYSLEFTSAQMPETDQFTAMARDVIREICTDYYPLIKTETITIPEGGELLFKQLSAAPLDIFSVKKDGTGYPFVLRYNRLEAAVWGKCDIEYSFMPDVSIIALILPFNEKIDSRIIGYGIAAEYCIINGLDDAVIWDKRYKDALKKAIRTKGEKRVKRRAWR